MIDIAFLRRLQIEPLDRKKHDRAAFTSGEPRIDNFLKTNAAGLQDLESTRCTVACLTAEAGAKPPIVGFYALNAHGIDVTILPEADRKKLGRYPTVPAVYLSMVGVDVVHQKKGVGRFLLADAFKRCAGIADQIGAAFIVLDSLNEDTSRLYRSVGFVDLPGHEPRMLIGMKVVRAAIARTALPAAQSA